MDESRKHSQDCKELNQESQQASGANNFLSLLSWRNTVMEGLSTSPAQLMFGWCMWTHLQGALAIAERRDSQSNTTSSWQEPDMVQSRNRRTSRCAILHVKSVDRRWENPLQKLQTSLQEHRAILQLTTYRGSCSPATPGYGSVTGLIFPILKIYGKLMKAR